MMMIVSHPTPSHLAFDCTFISFASCPHCAFGLQNAEDNIHAEVVHEVHYGTGHCALQNWLEGLLPKISESLLIAQICEPDCYEICF